MKRRMMIGGRMVDIETSNPVVRGERESALLRPDPDEEAILQLTRDAQDLPTERGGTILRQGEIAMKPRDPAERRMAQRLPDPLDEMGAAIDAYDLPSVKRMPNITVGTRANPRADDELDLDALASLSRSDPEEAEEQDGDVDLGPPERQLAPDRSSIHIGEPTIVSRKPYEEQNDDPTPMPTVYTDDAVREFNAAQATRDTLRKAGFDENGDPLKKAGAVVARAKGLPGSSRELTPAPDRPKFGAIPTEEEIARGPGASSISKAVADAATAAANDRKELDDARESERRSMLAADLGEAGSTIANAGRGKFDRREFDDDRERASEPVKVAKENIAGRSAEAAKLAALEDKLRAAGRQAEADKLEAERKRAQMKHDADSLAETTRHNKAMEQLARSKGENNAGPQRLTAKEQERKDIGNSLISEVDRLTALTMDANGKAKADQPGVGPWDGSSIKAGLAKVVPGIESPEDNLVDQSIRNSVSKVVLLASGKSATNQERDFLMKSYGMERDSLVGGSQQKFTVGLQKFREDVQAIAAGKPAPNNPGAWAAIGMKPDSLSGQPAGSVAEPKSEAEYNALPSGTVYVKDGKRYKKP